MKYLSEPRKLDELLGALPSGSWDPGRSFVPGSITVTSITPDSRSCSAGCMFVAISGTHQDGEAYVGAALERGASCVVSRNDHHELRGPASRTPVIVTERPREFLSLVSQAFFGFPARELRMIGITGTSGKTSTAYISRSLLEASGIPCVMIGTTGYSMPDGEVFPPDTLPATTPEAFALNWYLHEAVRRGARVAVMEVSSFALAYDRVFGMRFDVGVFTNFSQDHMGYHKTMEAYLAAKLRLFQSLDHQATAILNADDPAFPQFRAACARPSVLTYSLKAPATYQASHIVSAQGATAFDLAVDRRQAIPVRLSLGPAYQASNGLAAIGAVHAAEPSLTVSSLAASLTRSIYVPGRYERIDCGQPFEVIVDYAHTPEEFSALFDAVRPTVKGSMIAVFGSVGADDRKKRPVMAHLAEEFCRWCYVTVEDPRHEDASISVKDIVAGFVTDHFTVINDRRSAIQAGIAAAQPGDAVLVLGRGHEQVMYYKDKDVFLDDREACRSALEALGYHAAPNSCGEWRSST